MSIKDPKLPMSGSDSPLEVACAIAQEAASVAASRLGPSPHRHELLKLHTAFRHALFPAKPPGRRRKEGVTAAHMDWKNGMRGIELYRKHIPGWEKHSRWRRAGEQRALRDVIHSRERRDRQRKNINVTTVES